MSQTDTRGLDLNDEIITGKQERNLRRKGGRVDIIDASTNV